MTWTPPAVAGFWGKRYIGRLPSMFRPLTTLEESTFPAHTQLS